LVKEGDKWLIAGVHVSSNLFDNPLLTMSKRMTYIVGGICLVLGVVAGFFLGRMRKRAA
jgi:hypothetical protein